MQRLAQLLAQGYVADASLKPTVMQQLTQEAERRCHPTLTIPLSVCKADLSPTQQAAIDAVLGALEQAAKEPCQGAGSPSSRPIILTIQGEPGTGKSTLLCVLVEEVRKLEKALVVTATSATAAHRLGLSYTDTVDTACQIPRSGPITSLRPDNAGTLALRLLDLLVCDELSMLSKDKLGNILHRLSQATAEGKPRKVLLLVGDCWQLSPVCRHKISDNEEEFLSLCQHCHLLHGNNFLDGRHPPAPADGVQAGG